MSPRVRLLRTSCHIAVRSRPVVLHTGRPCLQVVMQRGFAEQKGKKTGKEEAMPATGPNQDVLGHVSEEAAAFGKVTGGTIPDLDQGTPVQEILKRDEDGKSNAPAILEEEMDKGKGEATGTPESNVDAGNTKSSASSTVNMETARARAIQRALAENDERLKAVRQKLEKSIEKRKTVSRQEAGKPHPIQAPVEDETDLLPLGRQSPKQPGPWGGNYFGKRQPGHRYEVPEVEQFPITSKLQKRYEPIVDQVTKLLMRDGKLGIAQRNMSFILNYLRTSAPPAQNPQRPWVPGTPPAHQLPLNPVVYLATAIDSVAPVIRIKYLKGLAGGGLAMQIPTPLQSRQRRRTVVKWILNVINKRPAKGSGKDTFANKFAEEVVAVAEGKSSLWEKRLMVHRLGAAARANKPMGKFKKF